MVERVGRLAYKLQLPPTMSRIHPVISIAHLEPAHPPQADPFQRAPSEQPILADDGSINRLPQALLNKREMRRRNGGVFTQYLVRYQGLGAEYDQWVMDRNIPLLLRQDFDAVRA